MSTFDKMLTNNSQTLPLMKLLLLLIETHLRWMILLKKKIKWKNEASKTYIKNGCTQNDCFKLQEAISFVFCLFEKRKNYYCNQLIRKLSSPNAGAKTYRSVLKSFYNGKKIPLIPQRLHEDRLISDFQVKAHLFNTFLASQCTPL